LIPFELNEVHGGFSEATGVMYLEGGYLVFEVMVTTLGIFKREPETIKVELGVIDTMRLEKRFRKDRLFIRPTKPQLLHTMPGKHEGALELRIKRAHRSTVEAIIREVESRQLLRRPLSDY
jgi:hypothetical protein